MKRRIKKLGFFCSSRKAEGETRSKLSLSRVQLQGNLLKGSCFSTSFKRGDELSSPQKLFHRRVPSFQKPNSCFYNFLFVCSWGSCVWFWIWFRFFLDIDYSLTKLIGNLILSIPKFFLIYFFLFILKFYLNLCSSRLGGYCSPLSKLSLSFHFFLEISNILSLILFDSRPIY